jgi:ketosteroid isomerase-like protein
MATVKLTTEQKIEKVKRGYEAFSKGDLNTVMEQQTDDIVWHMGGSTHYSGDHRGKQAVASFLANIPQDFEEFKLEVHDILASENHIAVLLSEHSRRNGKDYEDKVVHVHHVTDDGRSSEIWFALDTEQLRKSLES